MPGSGGSSCAKTTRSSTTSCSRSLRAGIVNARETAKKIAASPIVEQEGELCFSLYNAAGDCVLTSTGIIIHVGTMGAAIKYMIENGWEENPGIDPGDIFCNNDCLIGNVHPCDIHTIVPIFWEGSLIGWVGGVTHVIDTGAVGPGSMTTGQVQRFGDGYSITCRKVGSNDTLLRDWLHESQRIGSDDPLLDAGRAHPHRRLPHDPRAGRGCDCRGGHRRTTGSLPTKWSSTAARGCRRGSGQ